MNIQNEPMLDLVDNLSAIIKTQFPQIKNVILGWPEAKWLKVDKNMPAVFLVDLSETSKQVVSAYEHHRTVKNADGTGLIIREKRRLNMLVQMTLFTHEKLTRDQLGWQLKQYFVANFRIPITDYTLATPALTGEYMMISLKGDHRELEGEANLWRRDLTWVVETRILDGIPAWRVSETTVETSTHEVPVVIDPETDDSEE